MEDHAPQIAGEVGGQERGGVGWDAAVDRDLAGVVRGQRFELVAGGGEERFVHDPPRVRCWGQNTTITPSSQKSTQSLARSERNETVAVQSSWLQGRSNAVRSRSGIGHRQCRPDARRVRRQGGPEYHDCDLAGYRSQGPLDVPSV